ncbi:MAG: ABC transporter permease [Bacteroidia bacterium]|nr:ABC transporter permease [Bacteroidia bacterium]
MSRAKNKIGIIIQREYFSRVLKKSFWIMSFLPPILITGLFGLIIYFALQDTSVSRVAVVNESPIYSKEDFKNTSYVHYDYVEGLSENEGKKLLYASDYTAFLWIPPGQGVLTGHVNMYYKKQPGIIIEGTIRSNLENVLYNFLLEQDSIDPQKVANARKPVRMVTQKIDEQGNEKTISSEVNMFIGFGSAILIYMFIFLYGVQVMRGVIEEKTNRIVEVIVSSVKPFQLMLGKIIGVSLVGLTQLLLWGALTGILVSFTGGMIADNPDLVLQQVQPKQEIIKMGANVNALDLTPERRDDPKNTIANIYSALANQNIPLLVVSFLFYFLGGYLLYGAFFAAFGSAVDSETDTQQFMLPVSIPLIMGFMAAQFVMQNPEGSVGFWLSIFPLTSPVVMMVRLPFGVPGWELALSMFLLVIAFVFTTWLAGRIYRTGILMYGKKTTWKELGKWLFYKG